MEVKKILITGAKGFVGRNLTAELSREPLKYELLLADIDTPESELLRMLPACDFVVHLAGVNRPKDEHEFTSGNENFTIYILEKLEGANNTVPVAITSSIQSELDNAYGRSKAAAEKAVLAYGKSNHTPVYVWKLPNVFGKWCRPNYNSAVATFCYNTAHDLPCTVNDPTRMMTLIYIDDLLSMLKDAIDGDIKAGEDGYCAVERTYTCALADIPKKLESFKKCRESLVMPSLKDGLDKVLYSTYLSYLETDDFAYKLVRHEDARGNFSEFFKSAEGGQFSFSTTKPGITRGNHWHHTKVEKFLVLKGEAVIRFRKIDGGEVIEYHVSENEPTVVDIPVGYTHNFTNTSADKELLMIIWANELFDPEHPDTYAMEV